MSVHPADRPRRHESSTTRALAAAAMFVGVSLAVLYRHSRSGLELRDFRDGIYYAVIALLHGDNPYDTPRYLNRYPVEQGFSPYAPGFLSIHLPFGLLSFETAQTVYFLLLCVLGLALSHLAWKNAAGKTNVAATFLLATALLLSRPGSWNAGLGQYALQFSLGIGLALCLAPQRIWAVGLGCALTLFKPTYGAPLSLLMLCGGRTRAWCAGVGLAALLSLPTGIAVLRAAGGVEPFADSLRASYANFANDATAAAASGPERVDIIGLVGFALGHDPSPAFAAILTLTVLAIGTLAFHRLVDPVNGKVTPLALVVGCVMLLICTYHQTYDLVLLIVPVTAWATLLAERGTQHWAGRVLLLFLLFPLLNYLSPQAVQARLGIRGFAASLLTRANGLSLLAAFGIAATMALQRNSAARSVV